MRIFETREDVKISISNIQSEEFHSGHELFLVNGGLSLQLRLVVELLSFFLSHTGKVLVPPQSLVVGKVGIPWTQASAKEIKQTLKIQLCWTLLDMLGSMARIFLMNMPFLLAGSFSSCFLCLSTKSVANSSPSLSFIVLKSQNS
jgi:hypothetical protein